MMVLSKHTWWLGFALLSVLIGCSGEQHISTAQNTPVDSIAKPDTEMSQARIYLYDKNRVTAEIKADKILKFQAKDSTMAYVLDINVYDTTGQVSTHVVGDSGVIRENSGQLYIYGNVVVITEDQSKLETDSLYWDTRSDKIKTDAYVKITKGDDVIAGWGMEADQRLNRIKILKQVTGTITDPKELTEP
jgi:LPS export ABC transporter protein LptC